MRGRSGEGQRARRAGALLLWSTIIIAAVSVLLIGPKSDELSAWLSALGPLAPLAYLLGEIIQVVVIPIPGQPLEIAGGWMLGLLGGAVVGSLGAILGSIAAFYLARQFGRDWVRARLSGGVLARVDRALQNGHRAEWVFFALMMVPNFPRDPLCYLAGISGIRTRSFLLIALLGRPVGLLPWVALGSDGVAAAVAWQVGTILIAVAIWAAARLAPRLATWGVPEPAAEAE